MQLPTLAEARIGIIGLGYVGLPLAVYLSRHFPAVGFDIDTERVETLVRGVDRTLEVTDEEFAAAKGLSAFQPTSRTCGFAISLSSRCQRRSIRRSART